MTVTYTIQTTDQQQHRYFTAPNDDIEIIIPENFGTFIKDWNMMVSVVDAISLKLVPQNGNVTLLVDQDIISGPNDLFYLILIDGVNTWKAIRAGNFALTTSNREIINAPLQLDSGSAIYQFIGASGGTQDVVLPDPPATNDRYIIKNIFQNGFNINIKETALGAPVVTLGATNLKYIAECIYDGTEWQVILG